MNKLEKKLVIAAIALLVGGTGLFAVQSKAAEKAQQEAEAKELAQEELNSQCETRYEVGADIPQECDRYQPSEELLAHWKIEKAENERIDADIAEMKTLCSDLVSRGGTGDWFLIDQCDIVGINVKS